MASQPDDRRCECVQEETQKTGPALININTADEQTLAKLPGIGEKKARAIVEYRAKKPFKHKGDLKKIKGIGGKMFKEIEPLITL
ncbi:MAG: helix-hairpin-helix domain-containing protein [Deltaproteobacteria bacterium]|nr:helix-hairpin-helix domain-containing protein [Deltaproteobacteria bacterium]